MPMNGWVHLEGMTRKKHGCLNAINVKPTLSEKQCINRNSKPIVPGPVNMIEVDGREYRLLPRKLPQRSPTGPQLQAYLKSAPKKLEAMPQSSSDLVKNIFYDGDVLPLNLDWRNKSNKSYVPTPFNQGKCGSCYACATVYMMRARMMVQN